MVSELATGRTQLNPKSLSFNVKDLVVSIFGWLEAFNYDVDEGSHKYEVGTTPEEVKDLDIRLGASKSIDNYTKFRIEIAIQAFRAKREKGRLGSRTAEFLKGEGKITILSKLIFDYDNRWAKSPILHYLRGIYERYFYLQTKKGYISKILGEVASIESDIKNYLKME